MRRGPGISGLHHAAWTREQYKSVGEEVRKGSLAAMKEQMGLFKAKLEEFALKHKAEIRRDPEFRARFHAMCANIGVDPLASSKGIWAKALGFSDFYYELGVQVAEACWATRQHNGGLIELSTLLTLVNRRRGSQAGPASEDDVVRAIKKLGVLGGGFRVFAIGKKQYVRSVPGELNMDKNAAIEAAQGQGWVSRSALMRDLGWTAMRAETILDSLLRDGFALADDQDPGGERLFWFPCTGAGAAGAVAS